VPVHPEINAIARKGIACPSHLSEILGLQVIVENAGKPSARGGGHG